jgi:hypothetical protein
MKLHFGALETNKVQYLILFVEALPSSPVELANMSLSTAPSFMHMHIIQASESAHVDTYRTKIVQAQNFGENKEIRS